MLNIHESAYRVFTCLTRTKEHNKKNYFLFSKILPSNKKPPQNYDWEHQYASRLHYSCLLERLIVIAVFLGFIDNVMNTLYSYNYSSVQSFTIIHFKPHYIILPAIHIMYDT